MNEAKSMITVHRFPEKFAPHYEQPNLLRAKSLALDDRLQKVHKQLSHHYILKRSFVFIIDPYIRSAVKMD